MLKILLSTVTSPSLFAYVLKWIYSKADYLKKLNCSSWYWSPVGLHRQNNCTSLRLLHQCVSLRIRKRRTQYLCFNTTKCHLPEYRKRSPGTSAGLPLWLVLENSLGPVLHTACTTEEEATLQVPFLHRSWTWQQGSNDCPPACIMRAPQLPTSVPDYPRCARVLIGCTRAESSDRPHPKWRRFESLLPWITDNVAKHSAKILRETR